MITETIKRKFFFNDKEFADPNPNWNPKQVLDFYAVDNNDLVTAVVDNGEFNDEDKHIHFKFINKIGTKG